MKRYSVESASGCGNCYAEETPDGEFVRYEEAIAAIGRERPSWSICPPVEDGVYFWRNPTGQPAEACLVSGKHVFWFGTGEDDDKYRLGGEWAGPILPPE